MMISLLQDWVVQLLPLSLEYYGLRLTTQIRVAQTTK